MADTKTNEIAMFELGTHQSHLWRSSRNEWFGGTTGFYWGCNNAKDLHVRLETVPSTSGRPFNVVFHPSDRDRTWLQLFDRKNKSIDADFGFLAFTTPPLSASHSLDAKFTTTAMVRELSHLGQVRPSAGHDLGADRRRAPRVPGYASSDRQRLDGPPCRATRRRPVGSRQAGRPGRTGPRPTEKPEESRNSPRPGTGRSCPRPTPTPGSPPPSRITSASSPRRRP